MSENTSQPRLDSTPPGRLSIKWLRLLGSAMNISVKTRLCKNSSRKNRRSIRSVKKITTGLSTCRMRLMMELPNTCSTSVSSRIRMNTKVYTTLMERV